MFGLGLEVSDDKPARTRDPKTQGLVSIGLGFILLQILNSI